MRLLVLILVLAGTAACAAQIPAEIADCKVHKIWRFDKSAEDWIPDHNVTPFIIENGILSFTNTGFDPWIANNRIGGIDTSKCKFIGFKMRADVNGANQLYFGTDKSPGAGECKVALLDIQASDEFEFYEMNMSRLPAWDGKLTSLRLDSANGGSEKGAKVEIDWIAIYQVPARINFGLPHTGIDDAGAFISLPLRNTGGEDSGSGLSVSVRDLKMDVPSIPSGGSRTVTVRPEITAARTRLSVSLSGRTIYNADLVTGADFGSQETVIGNDVMRLSFRGNSRTGVLMAGDKKMGVFRPLASLAYKSSDGAVNYVELMPDTSAKRDDYLAKMSARCPVEGGTARVEWSFNIAPRMTEGKAVCKLTSDVPINILRFEGPRLLAGEESFGDRKDHALFPGIEYLERGEMSNAVKHIGGIHYNRRVPHPYKITVPLMAVEARGAVVGITWEPLKEWAKGEILPCAEFESPRRLIGADHHLLTVFAPSIPKYVSENSDYAAAPYRLNPGDEMALTTGFFARDGEDINDVTRGYYRAYGLPTASPVAHGVEGTIDLCMKAYTQSLWFPEKRGWKNHFGLGQTPAPNNSFASLILAESLRKRDPSIAAGCDIDPNAQLTSYLGTTMDWFSEGLLNYARSFVAKQRKDGSFPYEQAPSVTKKLRELSNMTGWRDITLGDAGSTNSGIITGSLNSILDIALRTGNPDLIDAGLKGLEKLNEYTVPRGAQTWEVHMHVPDILGAGQAVDANLMGYKLTGDNKYLDAAEYWAYTGVSFVYSWKPPIDPKPKAVVHMNDNGEGKEAVFSDPSIFYENQERKINPGATTPVIGTSYYFVNWLGMPVQWCGQAWANSVLRLTAYRPDPFLRHITDMVFASITQQQIEKGFLAGTYPDSWNLMTNSVNQAFISPDTIIDYAYQLLGEKRPFDIDSRGFTVNDSQATVVSFARIESAVCRANSMAAQIKYYPNQDAYVSLNRVADPVSVTVDGAPLARQSDLRESASGYWYDNANRAIHIKYRIASGDAEKFLMQVEW